MLIQAEYSHKEVIRAVSDARGRGLFLVQQPETPIRLIKEITDQLTLDADSKIAVLFTVEWAVYLDALGYDVTMLTQSHERVVQKACDMKGIKYILIAEAQQTNMRFDVVVGNPPFQKVSGDSKTSIGGKFVKDSFNTLLKSGGTLAMVAQTTILSGGQQGVWRYFSEYTPRVVDPFVNDRFFKVGIDICYVIVDKIKSTGSRVNYRCADGTVINLDYNQFKYSDKKIAYVPRALRDSQSLVILQKVMAKTTEVFDFRHSASAGQQHKIGFGIAPRININPKYFAITHTGEFTGKDAWVSHPCGIDEFYTNGKTVNDETIRTIFQGPLFHWILTTICGGLTSARPAGTSYFPKLDLNQNWTKESLYQHFGLTADEITYIEAAVK
jgi:hypothetical protein